MDLRAFVLKQTGEVLSFAPVQTVGCFLEFRGVAAAAGLCADCARHLQVGGVGEQGAVGKPAR